MPTWEELCAIYDGPIPEEFRYHLPRADELKVLMKMESRTARDYVRSARVWFLKGNIEMRDVCRETARQCLHRYFAYKVQLSTAKSAVNTPPIPRNAYDIAPLTDFLLGGAPSRPATQGRETKDERVPSVEQGAVGASAVPTLSDEVV